MDWYAIDRAVLEWFHGAEFLTWPALAITHLATYGGIWDWRGYRYRLFPHRARQSRCVGRWTPRLTCATYSSSISAS